jgi:hypothetical protein
MTVWADELMRARNFYVEYVEYVEYIEYVQEEVEVDVEGDYSGKCT